ncbi:hypothetical protein LOZ12_002940 [Ophidiomyces ophidiicola]|uniref:Uncharacterized protein n=1 Tax=Ophidiomyces ophidiicola TaxID=1387563 RepID=A0ACB8UYM0_9EURO|nr:hypothetical protein LOZ64_003146 [Ophidiomyces ophidiicola]KAI1953267.1 hypothetical protein LOZ62_001108 [Ophidiomyces ophidiicola]KAI2006382.1 hypothetical protein LOZ50_003107 [Ophidiomyces ophidiicola]KAI2033462.1 hypothetical protein LOZ45_000746 [Ophidiomyces ophidiicola]KAI2039302.1 hypothetical protein LOZ47_002354 [Ophidiomyces ophidiicola]
MKGFYYRPCPLCQQDVEVKQRGRFYVLPLHPAYTKLFSHDDWQLKNNSAITIQGLWSGPLETYPTLAYWQRSFLIHWRCYQLVQELSPSQLRLLIDVVEPTFHSRSLPPPSTHGAFFPPPSHLLPPNAIPLQCDLENQDHRAEKRDIEQPLGWWFHRLPLEIQGKIFEYNIGRLIYVMRAATQFSSNNEAFRAVPEHRLSETKLMVYDNMIRIHLVIIGGRTYIGDITSKANLGHIPQEDLSIAYSRTLRYIALALGPVFLLCVFLQKWKSAYILFSAVAAFEFMLFPSVRSTALSPMRSGIDQKMNRDYRLNECEYLAIKSDETGVVDIAFQQHHAAPKWILNNHTYPFKGKISVIRCADTHNLRIIRDARTPLVIFFSLGLY